MSIPLDSDSLPCGCGGGPGDCRGSLPAALPTAGLIPSPTGGPAAPAPAPAELPDVVTLPLAKLKVGQCGTIQEKRVHEQDRAMLRAMGLSCNASVTLCRQGEPCIVAVTAGGGGRIGEGAAGSCRIGLTRELSEKIYVVVRQPS